MNAARRRADDPEESDYRDARAAAFSERVHERTRVDLSFVRWVATTFGILLITVLGFFTARYVKQADDFAVLSANDRARLHEVDAELKAADLKHEAEMQLLRLQLEAVRQGQNEIVQRLTEIRREVKR